MGKIAFSMTALTSITVAALLLGVDSLRIADFLTGAVLILYLVLDK